MGRIFKPVEVSFNGVGRVSVGLLDTGADETVVSKVLAKKLGAELYGNYEAVCASGFLLKGKYADLVIRDLDSGKSICLKVGVSDVPFDTDDISEEGLDVILGVDFLQKVGLKIE